nr:hypothetical protein [Escherichia coli]
MTCWAARIFSLPPTLAVSHTDGQSYFRGLEIKDYSTETITGLYDSLLYARCRYVFTQSYTCMGKDEARAASAPSRNA